MLRAPTAGMRPVLAARIPPGGGPGERPNTWLGSTLPSSDDPYAREASLRWLLGETNVSSRVSWSVGVVVEKAQFGWTVVSVMPMESSHAWIDGAPAMATEGGQLGGTTVIIQYTQIATSRFEEYGGRPPYAKSTGSGKAVILRDGKEFTVRWSRPNLETGTTYTLPDGQRMQFAPGQVWVVLAPDSHRSYVNAAQV